MNQNHFLMIFFALITYWVVTIYQPFLLDIAIAILLALATVSAQTYFYKKTQNEILSVSLITIVMAIFLFGPIIYFVITISSLVSSINTKAIPEIIQTSMTLLDKMPESLRFLDSTIRDFVKEMEIAAMSKNILSAFGNIGAKSAVFIKDVVLIVIFFFFAHLYGRRMLGYLSENLPFDEESAKTLFNDTSLVMSITTYSIIITALLEGALFGAIVLFLGYDAILFGIMYGFASLIPVVGGILMWLPLALYEFYLGNTQSAIFVVAYSVIVISVIADTFVKPMIIDFVRKKIVGAPMRINSLIIFFAIVAGLSTHGFWGMILGPAVTSLFLGMISVIGNLHSRKL